MNEGTKIWLANPESHPVDVPGGQVVALMERVYEAEGPAQEDDSEGMVWQAAKDFMDHEHQQLEEALCACRHLFARVISVLRVSSFLFYHSKGDLSHTSIVKHQNNIGKWSAVKQWVRQFPVACQEEERKGMEHLLAIGIIQESNST